MAEPTITLNVTRYRPEQDRAPTTQTYTIPYREDWVVLDALNHIKDQIDGTLSYRWSCRMGVCGSCGMMVNGVPKLTCAAFLREYYPQEIRVEPLVNFPIIRDLIIDMSDFLDKLKSVKPWIIRKEEKPVAQGEYLQTPAELEAYKQFTQCINCMLCYAACPVYGLEPKFLGPAAIALGYRYNIDSRDQGKDQRAEIGDHDGIWDCTFVGECSVVCPKDVDPAAAIQRAKVDTTKNWFKSILLPWGQR
ncbi:MAG: succinate dehydrogenase/fumarate reductase iron-sulfur subunit [Candidatus Binatia bacterium]